MVVSTLTGRHSRPPDLFQKQITNKDLKDPPGGGRGLESEMPRFIGLVSKVFQMKHLKIAPPSTIHPKASFVMISEWSQ
jgi:hypothetical protein